MIGKFRKTFRIRKQGSGFRVQGSGFRVQGSGFRVQGSRACPPQEDSGFRARSVGNPDQWSKGK